MQGLWTKDLYQLFFGILITTMIWFLQINNQYITTLFDLINWVLNYILLPLSIRFLLLEYLTFLCHQNYAKTLNIHIVWLRNYFYTKRLWFVLSCLFCNLETIKCSFTLTKFKGCLTQLAQTRHMISNLYLLNV